MSASTLAIELSLPLGSFPLDVRFASDARALGVFGRSGAGKTSLLDAIAGWRRPSSGRIQVGERVLFDRAQGIDLGLPLRRVGYVPQDAPIFPHWTARENALLGRCAEPARAAALERLAGVLDLGELLDRPAPALSGGERRRVALARALCSGPDLLLLDEPLSGLDHELRRAVVGDLLRVRAELGARLVLVSHEAVELQALCDEVIVLERGRVAAQGAPAAVLPALAARGELSFENVLFGRVLDAAGESASVELAPGAILSVPRSGLVSGHRAAIGFRADDVLVALDRVERISARNVLAARVDALLEVPGGVLLRARAGATPGAEVHARLTHAAVRELALAPGAEVFLVLKSSSCAVLGATR